MKSVLNVPQAFSWLIPQFVSKVARPALTEIRTSKGVFRAQVNALVARMKLLVLLAALDLLYKEGSVHLNVQMRLSQTLFLTNA